MRAASVPAVLLAAACLCGSGAAAEGIDAQRLQRQAEIAGGHAAVAVAELLPLLGALRQRPADEQLAAINRFFNRHIRFATDEEVWRSVDYWASPLQSLAQGAGDCEDFAIAKYFSLLALGMPLQRLRLVYVSARLAGGRSQAHMVLAYYPDVASADTEVLVLDNLSETIASARLRSDLTPVFSFNSEGLWQGVGSIGAGNPLARLSPWREVLARARAEGFL